MDFKKANHCHDRVGSQVGRTIVIICFEMYMRKMKVIPQVILELSGKVLREFYDVSITIRFVGDETVNVWASCDTHDSEGDVGMSVHLYRVRMF